VKIAGRAGLTDPGRRRRRNEDAFVVDPPLFVIADGMGGAQAGEVAARLAASAFREFHDADTLAGPARLEAIVQEANRRIYERAHSDRKTSGMGTTVTAALVERDGIAIGHVGDSRAYRIRGESIDQLTQDHSLVADLVRSGRLRPEDAEQHRQRNVITRALGTDPEVDVDTVEIDAEAGDIFLLCSDGLTTMIGDGDIVRIVHEHRNLEAAAKALVKAANRRGGEDNVTVVLFAVESGTPTLEETAQLATDGQARPEDLEDTLSGLNAPTHPGRPEDTVIEPRAARTDARWEAVEEKSTESTAPSPRPEWRGARRLVFALAALVGVVLISLLALWGLSNAHFVGASDSGRVAVFQGLPYDLASGVSLYRPRYVSHLRAAQLSRDERVALFDHDLTSYGAARDRIADFEPAGVP
jgi:PPM family protein phosphatase